MRQPPTAIHQWRNRWAGETVFCLGSGPSMTQADADRLQGRRVIVVNTTFRLAPWADALFFQDGKWWRHYHREVIADFRGQPVTVAPLNHPRVDRISPFAMRTQENSGTGAIALALLTGASRIVLLGMDCMPDGERMHWHGSHPHGTERLGNGGSIDKWPEKFAALAARADNLHIPVINCSRRTALDCFPRTALEDELAQGVY